MQDEHDAVDAGLNTIVLPPHAHVYLGATPRVSPPWRITFQTLVGEAGTPPDTLRVRTLPTAPGVPIKLSNALAGSMLFTLPVGTDVRAIDAGTVIDAYPGTHVYTTHTVRIAPYQVVIVPIPRGNWQETVLPRAREIKAELEKAGIVVALTGNDAANAPMLAVNRRLGYRPVDSPALAERSLARTAAR